MTESAHTSTLRSLIQRQRFDGTVVFPGDDAWDQARQAWNLAVDQHPTAVAFPESVDDVVALVRVAGDADVQIVAQGTGHGATGYSSLEGTMLIKTERMRDVAIVGTTCAVGAGVLWGDVAPVAGSAGLAGLAGSSPDVGVVGYTLGGGIGWLSRQYGLAANRVRSIELVTADGAVRTVDADRDADLFWALRGGGGGLGVVTALTFDLVPLQEVYAGTLAWPAEHADRLLEAWSDWTASLDDSITSIIRFLNLPPIPQVPEPFRARRMMTLGAVGVGDLEAASRALDVMRSVVPPEIDMFSTAPPADLVRLHGDPEEPTPGVAHHTLLDSFGHDAARRFSETCGPESGNPLASVEVRHLGGALGQPVRAGGALSHIVAPYALFAVAMAPTPQMHAEAWEALGTTIDAMEPWAAGEYLNFVERPGAGAFPADAVQRLSDVKKRFDPDMRFPIRVGIAPSGA